MDSASINAHLRSATLALSYGKNNAALQVIDKVLAVEPNNVAALLLHVEVLWKLDKLEKALVSAQHAVSLEPENGNAYNLLALQLQQLGRDEEALVAFERAGTLLTYPGLPLTNQAMLLCQLNRNTEATTILDKVIKIDPYCANAWYARALMNRPNLQDCAAIEKILKASETFPTNTIITPNKRVYLHYALAEHYLAIGDGARAFAHLKEGSSIKRINVAYDGAVTEQRLKNLAASYNKDIFRNYRGYRSPSKIPVFIVGMPRSGSTLIEQILASHPSVYAAGELRSLPQAIIRNTAPTEYLKLKTEQIAKDYLAEIIALSPSATRIVDKLPSNIEYAGLIHLIFPNAKIIHCRRNPVDTCLSCYSKLFSRSQTFSYDLAELGHFYKAQEALASHWAKIIPAKNFIQIDYENVITNFEAETQKLFRFIGLEWAPQCLEFYKTERPIRTASMIEARQPLYKSSMGRWQQFREYLGPLLEALDYK